MIRAFRLVLGAALLTMLVVLSAAAAEGAVDFEALIEARDVARAGALARDSLAAAVAEHGALSPQALGAQDLLVKIGIRSGMADEDLRALAAGAVEGKLRLFGDEHAEVAHSLHQLGDALDLAGVPDEAKARMEEALAMRRRVLGPGHPDVALSLFGMAIVAVRHGDVAGARDLLEEALAIQEAAAAPPGDTAATLVALSSSEARLGEVEEALPRARRAVTLVEALHGPGHVRTVVALHNLATVQFRADRTEEAIATSANCAVLLEHAGPEWDWVRGRAFNNLGELERARGDFVASRTWLERAVAVHERSSGPSSPSYAFALNSLGLLQLSTGDLVSARRSFERVREVYEATVPPDDPSLLFVLTDLATVELRSGDAEEAVRLMEQAVPGLEAAFGESPDVAYAWGTLGEARLAAGDAEGAREPLERALAVNESVFGPESGQLTRGLGLLGRLHARTGDAQAAEAAFRRCLAIAGAALGEDSLFYESELMAYAAFLLGNGETQRAFDTALQADELSRRNVSVNVRGLAEREALAFLGVRSRGTDVLLAILAAEPPGAHPRTAAAWDAVIRARGQVLDEMIERNRAVAGASDPEAIRAQERYRRAGERLARLRLAQSEGAAPPEETDAARAELDAAERDLAQASASFRDSRARAGAGLAEAAAGRPAGSAVVGYVKFHAAASGATAGPDDSPARYLAFVLPAGRDDPVAVPLGPADRVDERVRAWRASLAADEDACRAAGAQLREALWDPVEPWIGDAALVLVVPDGAVHGVTLAALPDRDSGYLVESGPAFHYLSSERDAAGRASAGSGSGLLVLGGAAYDADPRGGDLLASADPPAGLPAFRGPRAECADFAGHRFRPLPATAAEAREVAERFGEDAVRLEGDAATEAAFRAQAPGRRVLHLATHGFFLGGGCAGGESGGDGTRGVTGVAPLDGARTLDGARPPDVHPLLLSGLALAGANRRAEAVPGEDDGILTAQEIGALDLGGVEWAVLSACDTGIGRVEAEEGVLGLRRAFAVAGARTVLMSLWPVRDEDARAWMARLYRERAGGATTADAVRAADRAWLAALREAGAGTHPARWGAFVAVGDWR